ncbi:unnamed protein product [Acanthoscelides obtectus]|uniref:CCR4-NOT transcription complex subunit 4 n=1 Tax=Acanthoscelides obtectus TaxID=200917 RepID=A0A9P0PU18_ACAOB|nr:unnamed protein product [Acanthoscelides obtectus]CAK1644889.1 CCR4-NOT transcription complex subunit 4 [Acanthoscelides obtectus]
MSVLNQSGEEQVECPLCMEPLEVDDLNFFPCTCGYQICRFCWHRIRTDENGLCPACRKAYSENPADFIPLSQEQVAKLKAEKRQRDQQRKAKLSESRKHLASVRVVQRNLVFVVGLPMRLAEPEVLKRHEYFGKFGKIHKVVINQSTSYAGSQGPSASAYVTYMKSDDALRAIQSVNNITIDGRLIKSSLGTTKYCSHFMKNQPCPKPDCMYLHDYGDAEASFTKEQMHAGKHQEYEKKLHENFATRMNQQQQAASICDGKNSASTPIPTADANSKGSSSSKSSKENVALSSSVSSTSSSTGSNGGGTNKENWPHLNNGVGEKDKESSKKERGGKKSKTKEGKKERKDGGGTREGGRSAAKQDGEKTDVKDPTNSARTGGGGSTSPCSPDHTSTTPPPGSTTPTLLQQRLPSTSAASEQTQHLLHQTLTTSTLLKLPSSVLVDDNSSFFSANAFQKAVHTEDGRPDENADEEERSRNSGHHNHLYNIGHSQHHDALFTDCLPDIETQEDWAAAFGFARGVDNGSGLLSDDIGKRGDLKSPLDTSCNGFTNTLSGPETGGFAKKTDQFASAPNGFYDLNASTAAAKLNMLDMLMAGAVKNGFGSNAGVQQHPQPPNGLDQTMNKFFTDFQKNNKDAAQQFTNGFTGLHQNYYAGLQTNAERVMFMQQKQLEEQLLNLTIKQGYGGSTNPVCQNGINLQQPQHYLGGENGRFANMHSQLYGRTTVRPMATKSSEDDLGFDPIQETQKAFAELMASEQTHKTQHNSTGRSQINGVIHNQNGGHLPPPPPGFIQSSTHMNSFGSKILPFLNMSSSQQINGSATQNNWPSSFNSQLHQHQKNITNSCNDWKVLDPAILSSSRHYPLAASNIPQQPPGPPPALRDNFQQAFAQPAPHQPRSPLDYQANNTLSNFLQHQQLPQQSSPFAGAFSHLNSQTINWPGSSSLVTNNDINGQISSPPGFRNAQQTTTKQEC